jgi:hypothetical protein
MLGVIRELESVAQQSTSAQHEPVAMLGRIVTARSSNRETTTVELSATAFLRYSIDLSKLPVGTARPYCAFASMRILSRYYR